MLIRVVAVSVCLLDICAAETVGFIRSQPKIGFLGAAQVVTIDGPLLAVSGGQKIQVVDISAGEPFSPRAAHLGAFVQGHFQSGATIFANLASTSSLAVLDFSADPAVTLYSGKPDGIPASWSWNDAAIVQERLYVASYEGLTCLDISNRGAPVVVRHLVGGPSGGLASKGEYLFMGVRETGLAVYKVGNDAAPRLVKTITMSGTEFLLDVAGNLLAVAVNYISGSSFSETWFYDITDPAEPVVLGWGPIYQQLLAIKVEGNTMFTASSARLRAFDISGVTAPVDKPYPLALPLLGYRYDFEQGFIGMATYNDGKNVATLEAGGASFWSLQRAAPQLTARRDGTTLRLEWTAPVPGPFEVQSQKDLTSAWESVAATSSNSLEVAITGTTQSRYYRILVLPGQ